MRPIRILSAGMLAVSLVLSGCGGGQEAIDVHNAWVQEAPASGATSAYMVLQNPTPKPITLVSAQSDAARSVEIQSVLESYQGEQTEKLEKLTVPSMGRLVLEPKNLQLKLIDLQKALNPGDTVTLKLNFDNGATVSVQAEVKSGKE